MILTLGLYVLWLFTEKIQNSIIGHRWECLRIKPVIMYKVKKKLGTWFKVTRFEITVFQWFPTFFCSRTPMQKKNKNRVPLSGHLRVVSLKILVLFLNWRTPWDFSRTPGGTSTPGWEPLDYTVLFCKITSGFLVSLS